MRSCPCPAPSRPAARSCSYEFDHLEEVWWHCDPSDPARVVEETDGVWSSLLCAGQRRMGDLCTRGAHTAACSITCSPP